MGRAAIKGSNKVLRKSSGSLEQLTSGGGISEIPNLQILETVRKRNGVNMVPYTFVGMVSVVMSTSANHI